MTSETKKDPEGLHQIGPAIDKINRGLLPEADPEADYLLRTGVTKTKLIGELTLWGEIQRFKRTSERLISNGVQIALTDFQNISGNPMIVNIYKSENEDRKKNNLPPITLDEAREKVRRTQVNFYHDKVQENTGMLNSMFEMELQDRISLLKERVLTEEEITEIADQKREDFNGNKRKKKDKRAKGSANELSSRDKATTGLEDRKRKFDMIKAMRLENNYFFVENFPVYVYELSELLKLENKPKEEIEKESNEWQQRFDSAKSENDRAEISRMLRSKLLQIRKMPGINDSFQEIARGLMIRYNDLAARGVIPQGQPAIEQHLSFARRIEEIEDSKKRGRILDKITHIFDLLARKSDKPKD